MSGGRVLLVLFSGLWVFFIIGDWPLYFIGFEMFGILVLGLFYIPMIILRRKRVQFAVR